MLMKMFLFMKKKNKTTSIRVKFVTENVKLLITRKPCMYTYAILLPKKHCNSVER